ncbi:MAG TPA: hypothetical protein V6D19_17830 [Stenomitos sp.]
MNVRILIHAFAVTLLSLAFAHAAHADVSTLEQEVAALRQLGAKGLQQFLNRHASEFQPGASLPSKSIRDALDTLCQQKDCYASRLYWYTDLAQAQAAAKASGKPILSLRLLGNLDQDLSCANSRFFRVALYPNAEVSQVLRDRFILHWQSVRPVPKVTIDFGDGRTLERTLTGNSIHYVLDANGHLVDAIPGLYGPQAFLQQLRQSEGIAKTVVALKGAARDSALQQYYRDRLNRVQADWSKDLGQLGLTLPARVSALSRNLDPTPRADVAGTFAASKMMVENPIVSSALNQTTLTQMTDQTAWEKLAQLHQRTALLDRNSINLIQAKQASGALPQARPVSSIVRSFEASMALDTVRNEYLLHSQIYQWLLRDEATFKTVDALNTKVYADLFLTPSTDPWLGLLPSGSYSAIDNDGIGLTRVAH